MKFQVGTLHATVKNPLEKRPVLTIDFATILVARADVPTLDLPAQPAEPSAAVLVRTFDHAGRRLSIGAELRAQRLHEDPT